MLYMIAILQAAATAGSDRGLGLIGAGLAAGLAVLKSRVQALPDAVALDGDLRLEVKVAAVASEELRDRRVAASVLMGEMQGALG